MRLQRLRFEFGMELASDEEWMAGNFDDLDVSSIRRRAGNLEAAGRHRLFILAVELITMPVALADFGLAIDVLRQRPRLKLARPRPESHRPAEFFNTAQFAQFINHAMRSCRVKFT